MQIKHIKLSLYMIEITGNMIEITGLNFQPTQSIL